MSDRNATGFAGLIQLATDADSVIASAKAAAKPVAAQVSVPAPSSQPMARPAPQGHTDNTRQSDTPWTGLKSEASTAVVFLLGALVVILLLATCKGEPKPSSTVWSPSEEAGTSDYAPPAAEAAAPAYEAPAAEAAAPEPYPTESTDEPAYIDEQALQGSAASLTEDMPPMGSGQVLSRAQITYCLAEGARLEGSKQAVDSYSEGQVQRFNRYVNDYNSRCSNYRYRPYDMTSAREAVDQHLSELHDAGTSRIAGE